MKARKERNINEFYVPKFMEKEEFLCFP